MCTLTAAAVTIAAANFGLKIKEAFEAKGESDYQKNILMNQAKQAQNDAAYERQEGIEESRRKKLQSILKMGDEKAAMASGNIALSSSTALNVVDNEKMSGELDSLSILKSSEKSAKNYMRQSRKYYEQASLTSFRGKKNFVNSLLGSTIGLGSDILSIHQKKRDEEN